MKKILFLLVFLNGCSSEIITPKETNTCLNPVSFEFSNRIEHAYIKGIFDGKSIVNGGEWSTAFREVGAGDFVGGWHGDHVLVSQTENENTKTQTLDLKSYFDDSTISNHKRTYTFDCNSVTVEQTFKFEKDVVFDSVFFAMLPVLRNGVTHSAERFNTGLFENVATNQFERQKTADSAITIWGDEIEVKVEVLESSLDYLVFVSNAEQYNKVYFGQNTKETKAQTGEEWTFKTKYTFNRTQRR